MRSILRHSRLLLALVGLCLPAALGIAAPTSSPTALAADEMMLPVPVVTIYPGDTIKESMLRFQAYPSTFRARAAVIDAPLAIVGRTARRMLLPGEPVPVNAIDDPRLVTRGTPTQMIFEENGLVITAVGSPLQNGGLGETIRVRNTDTNRIVLGTVMADGRIKIGGF
ncbi:MULTISPECIES: flagellar basal body P-ring formation chaperone FlgA [Methylobacterium]|uniref:flagellar basal body P-ring formation chaperone FlgA n=1 Tax=Methylobacterium TaxID=407 RepID=UPI0013EC2354|nr:flagellar basal body P-ring formation chaperone FlgA [Methylobacterium sp. DB0501]NGM35124.1 flagellar basal body P-ring formation protein FlgA [Methylobacterium sp. DB0501]